MIGLWAWAVHAGAAPVERGLQAEIHTGALGFASARLEAEPLQLGPFDLDTNADCYHTLNVRDFALTVPFEAVDVTLREGAIDVDVRLGEVYGENIAVRGVSGWVDLCVDFDTVVEYVRIRNGRIRGTLVLGTEGDRPTLAFAEPPTLTATFDTQVNWFPDDLAWSLFGDVVLDTAAQLIADSLPELLDEPIDAVIPTGFGDVPTAIAVRDLVARPDGVFASADVDIGGNGGGGPTLDLAEREGSHLAVGITEDLLQDVLHVAQTDGILAAGTDATEALIADLQETIGLEDVEPRLDLDGEPSARVSPDGLRLGLPGLVLEAEADGERLLYLAVDLEATLDLAVDPAQASIVLSTHDVVLDVREIDVSRLVHDEEGARNLERFLQGWVADAVGGMVGEIPVFSSQFPVLGTVVRLDEIDFQDRGVGAWLTLFDPNDPAVDLVPPDSQVAVEVEGDAAVATLGGVDDREGALTFSYSVDGLGWSTWRDDPRVELRDLAAGSHTIEVRARDAWQNSDPTPAASTFTFEIPEAGEDPRGCGCGGAGAPAGGWLLGLVALGTVGRRSGRRSPERRQ